MINSSDTLDYIPCGQLLILDHPEFSSNQENANIFQSTILEKLQNINITSKSTKDSWVIRNDKKEHEEELFYSGNLAVYSKGSLCTNTVPTSYRCDENILHATWSEFQIDTDQKILDGKHNNLVEFPNATVDCICFLDHYNLRVVSDCGENYVSRLPFKVSNVWSTKYGIILEKSLSPDISLRMTSLENPKYMTMDEDSSVFLVYSLKHPLDDTCPVLIKHGGLSYLSDSNLRIIFTGSKPSLAFIFDVKTGLHSIYKIRKATQEEIQVINATTENTFFTFNSVFSSSLHNPSLGIKNNSSKTIFNTLDTSVSPFGSKGSSYTTCSANISLTSQHMSRSQSPMATISRCQSPTNPTFTSNRASTSSLFNRTHQIPLPNSMRSESNAGHSSRGPNNFNKTADHFMTETLVPDLCFEHVWTENGQVKDIKMEQASRAFLTTDLVGQTYFCYLIQSQCRLILVRLEKSSDSEQIILGMVTSIVAKDAIELPKLKMMVIMDSNGNMTMYSGTSFVGKLHIPTKTPSIIGNNYILPNFHDRKKLSPFPRRSSLISPSKSSLPDRFEENFHLFSPVGGNCNNTIGVEHSLIDNSCLNLKDAVSNKLILEHAESKYLTINLPTFKALPLISMCLQTLQNILPRDLAIQLLIKWYVSRNAPGPQDLTISQEWNLFLITLSTFCGYDVNSSTAHDLDSTFEHYSPNIVSKKQKTTNNGSANDWSYLIASDVTNKSKDFLSDAIGLNKWKNDTQSSDVAVESENVKISKISPQSAFVPYLPNILFSLHLLYEEIKLNSHMSENLFLLAKLLHQLSIDLNLNAFKQHYVLDFPSLSHDNAGCSSDLDIQKLQIPNIVSSSVPNIFKTLNDLLRFSKVTPYPYQLKINPVSKELIRAFSILNNVKVDSILELDHFLKSTNRESQPIVINKSGKELIEEIVMLCYKTGLHKQELDNLPPGIKFVFHNIIYQCKDKPPSDWPSSMYELIDRQDLTALEKKEMEDHHLNSIHNDGTKDNSDLNTLDPSDGMEFDYTILQLRFNLDHRVREVRKLLDSSQPIPITIVQKPEISDHDFIEEQEKYLYALCTRTMALPVGRGMFTLRTSAPINTEQLPIPRLCLTGKAPPRGTTVELKNIDIPTNMNLWPLFNNGVATGLCIHPGATNVDSTWIVYNKQQQGEFGIEHSGFLMALGLNGHLKNLAPFSLYEYLVECHETTSVGLLLGLSATYRGTMNVSMTKLLSLHVETLLPPTSIELNVQQNVQVAALMGVGLVYQETNHRHIAHALLSEIGRPPGPEMKNCVDRESYSLTAGLALGLVMLCSGGKSDLDNLPDTLHYYMVGGNTRPFCGAQKDKYKSPSYQIREGDSINIDVTSPGATMALGLIYLKSGNHAVAEWMAPPNTQYLLDFVRPDFLMLRILSKSLILWNEIEPSKTWVSSHVPSIVARYKLQKPTDETTEQIDFETINQVYCNIIAGACMALGLKYAGTANEIAFSTLYHFLKMFITLTEKSVAELAGKATIETCLNVVLLSASIVMAGTGNLDILRVCRYVRSRVGPTNSVVTYGSHVAIHMALGFLFLGGGSYSLSNDPGSVAALIISLFPKFPTHSNDNRYHLQALRHFYVLASEPRLLLPKDIDSKKFCYAKISLTYESENQKEGQKTFLKAPCLLPQLDRLSKIELNDDRYWGITFENNRNFNQLRKILKTDGILSVKQKAGCLSHIEDPQGFRTLLAQILTTEDIIVWIASIKQIVSFTTDTTVLNFVNQFLKKENLNNPARCDNSCINKIHDKLSLLSFAYFQNSADEKSDNLIHIHEIPLHISIDEKSDLQKLITMTYECVIKDKINFLPNWLNIHKMIPSIKKQPATNLIWQLKFLHWFKISSEYFQKQDELLSIENILAKKQRIYHMMDAWENDLSNALTNVKQLENKKFDLETLKKLVAYNLYYDVPCPMNQLATFNLENMNKVSCSGIYGALKFHKLNKKN